MRIVIAVFLLLLAAWGLYAGRRIGIPRWPWSVRSWLFCVTILLLEVGALLSGVSLLAGVFAPWMLLPMGVSYITMLPLPCYFPRVTATRTRRVVRNSIFVLIAATLLVLGMELLPLPLIGH